MSPVIQFVQILMSLLTPDHDQGPKTETKGDPPTQMDPDGSPFQPPHHEAATRQHIVYKSSQHAHCGPQMIEKYGRLKERYKAVFQERNDLRDQIGTMQSTIDQHVNHLHRSKSTANALQDQLAATRAELVQVRQDLQASRSFVSTEASDGGKILVDMLSVLNQKIDEFAYIVGDLVPPQTGEARFTPPKAEKGLGSLETLGDFAIQTNLSLAEFLQYGIQHGTCKHLLDLLFMQFAPAIDGSLSQHLNTLHRSLSLHYPQAHGGRWRAMTYRHIRPQSIEVSDAARSWVERTLAFVNLCVPGCHPANDTLPMKAHKKAEEMFRAALDLQDKARTAYLAYNYEVFAVHPGSRFKEGEMDYGGDNKKKQKGHGEVVAVLGLGLKAWRSVSGDEGQYVREEVVPVRVSVLTNV
jgi:hypothetical protein